jgi:hypothetical protein
MNKLFLTLALNTALFLAPVSINAQTFQGWHDSTNVPNSQYESYGWVCITNQPTPLVVKFYDGNSFIGQTVADLQRENAVGAICGGSNSQLHGFIWPYPNQITNGGTHYITARAVVNGVETPLSNTPVIVSGISPSPIEGWLDFVTPDYVWGWSCKPGQSQDNYNSTTIDLYTEEQYLGSAGNQIISADTGVGSICGSRNRTFQIVIPTYLQNNQTHTIYAYASTSNNDRRLIGMKKANFLPQPATTLGIQRAVTPFNIDDVIGASVIEELPPSDGLLRVNSYCYGAAIDDTPITWDPSPLTGFYIPGDKCDPNAKICTSNRSQYQRGLIDAVGEYVVQAKDFKYGFYVKSNGFGYNAACGDIAGTGAGFSWYPGSPTPWPTSDASVKAREIYIKYKASVSVTGGISYLGNAFFFRDRLRNQFVWVTTQAFDTRFNVGDEFIGSDGSPIVGTSFNLSGTRGRPVKGSFVRGATMGETEFEFRLNGYQFEQILLLAGCGSSTLTSCNPADFDMTIGFASPETASPYAFIGATISDIDVGITNVGAYQ